MLTKQFKKGFTLIELLTVIAIIAVLTGVLTVSFVSVSARSRDGQRKVSIRQIQTALETYRADNDSYPAQGAGNTITGGSICGSAFSYLSQTYMTKMPCDPKTTTMRFHYIATPPSCAPGGVTPCTGYSLSACLENSSDKEGTSTQPAGFTTCTFTTPPSYFTATNI